VGTADESASAPDASMAHEGGGLGPGAGGESVACLSVMLRDNAIEVCCDADAQEDGDDPPQREVADQRYGTP
jgi:hypothetical protein